MQIMEKNHRDGDDLNSGWLEVKKKHRSNTKVPIPISIGTSRVRADPSRKAQELTKSQILVARQLQKSSSNKPLSTGNRQKNINSEGNVPDTKTVIGNDPSDIRIQSQSSDVTEENMKQTIEDHSLQFGEIEPPMQATNNFLEKVELKDMADSKKCFSESCARDTSNIVNSKLISSLVRVPKIKWGNLDEDELKGNGPVGMLSDPAKLRNLDSGFVAEDKIPVVVSEVHVTSKVTGSDVQGTSTVTDDQEDTRFSDLSFGNSKMCGEDSVKDHAIVSRVDTIEKSEICNEQYNPGFIDVKGFCKAQGDGSIQNESAKWDCSIQNESAEGDTCESESLATPNEAKALPCQDPNPSCMDNCQNSLETTMPSKVSVAGEDIKESVSSLDNIHLSEGREYSSECENLFIAEYSNTKKDMVQSKGPDDIIINGPLDRQKFNEDRSMAETLLINALQNGESKERFRERLWCYLFENLNRAIDELYLLCELECDVDQMKEAVVVLEEAQSDFRELKTRVEGFDTVKESLSASKTLSSGIPVDAKVEYRRPHALSWEVRRMASSPRRAEILSSSLEAFKKIQEESVSKNATRQGKRRDAAYPVLEQKCKENLPGKSPGLREPTSKEVGAKLKGKQACNSVNCGSVSDRKHTEMMKVNKENASEGRIVQKNAPFTSPPLAGKEGNVSTSNASMSSLKVESSRPVSELEIASGRRIKLCVSESPADNSNKTLDPVRRYSTVDKEKDRKALTTKASFDAWKEKRNWEDILASPLRSSSRTAHSPIVSRRSTERVRVLHDKLMSPERRRKSPQDMKKEAEEKHARATRIRRELENERQQRLQRVSEKLNRVSVWQAVKSSRLREGMHARQQRGESRHEAYLAQISRRASDESNKVSEVRFITSLSEENKKLSIRQKLQDSELRRAERLQIIKIKQKEDIAREEAVLERRKLLEAEKLQRLAEIQRKKEEAQARREEERKAASAAREAKAVEQVRKKEVRAKAQREEAELQAQKLAERLSESELRRKIYLEQIREKAAMDFREQSSPSSRRPSSRDGQPKSAVSQVVEGYATNAVTGPTGFVLSSLSQQQSLKKRVKKIRQRLMALKYEFVEPPVGIESAGLGTMAVVGAARSKLGRWLQDLQRLQQTRKAGAGNTGLIIGEMVKYLEGKDAELHAARQAGLLDFIASALPASHTSKPEACQTTISLLRIVKVLLALPANRSYFLACNLLPPLIPMLSTALENYCTIAASNNSYGSVSGNPNSTSIDKLSDEKLETIGEVLEGLLWSVAAIMGHNCSDECHLQMQENLIELIVACKVIHNLRDLFSLFDRPQIEGAPFPVPVLLVLNLLRILTFSRGNTSFKVWEACASPVVVVPAMQKNELADYELSLIPVQDLSSNIHSEKGDGSHPPEQSPKEDTKLSVAISMNEEAKKELPSVSEHGDDIKQLQALNIAKVNLQRDATGEWTKSHDLLKKDDRHPVEQTIIEPNNVQLQSGDDPKVSVRNKTHKVQGSIANRSIAFLVSVIAETGLVGLPSLLTAVLLQANSRSTSEQTTYMLPSNFEEVATGVLKIMNNLARLDLTLVQNMLARPDLQMEFFHLMSFLLSHCTSKWKCPTDQVAILLFETLLLLGYFALLHSGNQAVLRWGKSPTILHKICDLPFAFFSDPQLTPVLVGTLLAVCYGCEQNRDVVQQELSMDMLLVLLKSSKQDLHAASDSRQTVLAKAGVQLDVQSNSISYQSGTMDVIKEESEEEMQRLLENDPALNSQEVSRKASTDPTVIDIPVFLHQQPNGRPSKPNFVSDHAHSMKRSNRSVSKTVSQGETFIKEPIGMRTGAPGKTVKGKTVSSNKEISANQVKGSKISNSESIQKGSTFVSSKRTGSATLTDLKTNSSIGMHSQGLKVSKECEENPLLSPAFMLQNRFPINLIDWAQEFFAAGLD